MGNPQSIKNCFFRLRSVLLLAALLGVILAVPLMAIQGSPGTFARISYTAVFCVAIYLLGVTKRWIGWYLALAIPTLILGILTSAYPETRNLDVVRDSLTLGLQLMMITAVVKFSLLNREASEVDRIIAGICGYLILGLLWSDAYSILDHFDSNALVHSAGHEVTRESGSILYFSFVTLTTLGYGDITPHTPFARMLAVLEAATGTLYLAVLISSLVSGLRRNQDNLSSS